jgi:hypothetical protein
MIAASPAGDDGWAWRGLVEEVHAAGALIGLALGVTAEAPGSLAAGAGRAADAGFDLLLLDAEPETGARPERTELAVLGELAALGERLPAAVAAARAAWRAEGWIAAAVRDRPAARAAVIGHAAQLVRAGCQLLWVSAPGETAGSHGARLPAAPLADRLRNELGVATAIACDDALLPDLDAAIGAGRADLVALRALPDGARRAT